MTKYPKLFAALFSPFEAHEVRQRTQGGRQMQYITARTAMNRLDAVLGPENWWDEYVPAEHSVLCKLTIRLPDDSILVKTDAGGYAGMADQGDDDKSGYSDAFKRTAVKFGVGRYLYGEGVTSFADGRPAPSGDEAPEGPKVHRPAEPVGRDDRAGEGQPSRPTGQNNQTPRSGRALFAWTKQMEQTHRISLLAFLNAWAKVHGFPSRMTDWDQAQVADALDEAQRKLASLDQEAGW